MSCKHCCEKCDHTHEEHEYLEHDGHKRELWRLIFGAVIFVMGILFFFLDFYSHAVLAVFLSAYAVLGTEVVLTAVKNIIKGRVFDENFLMSVSTIGAFVIGEGAEAVAVMLFYQIGEYFQDRALSRSRRSISALLDIRPDFARVIRGEATFEISPADVMVGETIVVKSGERVPLDGKIIDGFCTLDTSALTGESVPFDACLGDIVLSGSVNLNGVISVCVTHSFSESTASKIIDMVENASDKKAPAENFITVFARYYTPFVVICALLLSTIPPLTLGGGWMEWINRALVFLVVSCPCALVISIPLAYFSGIGAASAHGVLVKGGNYLDTLARVKTVAFDKTGTLTSGKFYIDKIISVNSFSKEALLEYAAAAEKFSNHPIAIAVNSAYNGKISDKNISDFRELAGRGVYVCYKGKRIIAGNEKLMTDEKINYIPSSEAGSKIYLSAEGEYIGCVVLVDEIKKDGMEAVCGLKRIGIQKTVMLTGDSDEAALRTARALSIDEYHSHLLPSDKVACIEKLCENGKGGAVAFVGDGINDAPVLARADVGVAMGALGSDAAIEAADIVIMTDEPSRMIDAVKIARRTRRIAMQNIVFSLSVKGIILLLGALGVAGMWCAVFGDVGVAVVATLNSMRNLKT